ncbi:heparinase II/III family protein [Methylobacterium sp. J-090]|uniref:heparinase II/III domain-containing protein n=1 Tax=Methylobacterium sp. J-090 TaxID=2836666 RepID=UPI001FB9CFD7|nr:heparinase II/III family protein [Methylobacterium sp. J-090]MCJ2083911.1 heparinase II/III family protein [Methylobacterium sp. J-090]
MSDRDGQRPQAARHAGGATIGPGEDEHWIPEKNRFSRVVFGFPDLAGDAWCSLAFRLGWEAGEAAVSALDFALVGIDCLAPDGSSLDFDHVPGLDRTLLDPHGTWIPGPAYLPADALPLRAGIIRLAFLLPAPATGITVTVRSWRNTRPFTVAQVRLAQMQQSLAPGHSPAARMRRRLGPEPDWIGHALVPGCGLVLRGQIFTATPGAHAALARVVYRDAHGAVLAPPYPGTISVPALGALIDLSAHQQARRFTLELAPVPGADRVEVGFATWEDASPEAELLAAPEIALEDRLRLESLCGDDPLEAPDFLARLAERLGLPAAAIAGWCPTPEAAAAIPQVLATARSLQRGEGAPRTGLDRVLRFGSHPAWTVPEAPDWTEDPFRSVAWRIAYQGLGWLVPLAGTPGGAATALALALSWSRTNPWGSPADGLALHPSALTVRTEALVHLLGRAGKAGGAASLVLTGEVVRHGFALAEIVGQNTFGRALHQIQAAAVLMGVARALPRLPLSAHWLSLARAGLRAGLESQLDAEGRFSDPSLHQRLECATLLRVLAQSLDADGLAPLLAARVAKALPGLARLLDPGGRLPPFGDTPPGGDPAAWIGRLMARSGSSLVAERRDPRGRPEARTPPLWSESGTGMIAARSDAPGRGWSHFACTFSSQGFSGQAHRDCTSFVHASEGVRWIVESGGSGQIETGAARHHILSAHGHNVAWPDGREPGAGEAWAAGSIRLDGAQVRAIGTNVHGPDYGHIRVFVLLDDLSGLAVLDRFTAGDRPVTFEGLVHVGPEIVVALAGPRRAVAQAARARLSLVPVALTGRTAGLSLAIGCSEHPGALRGFVSDGSGPLQPTSVLRYAIAGRDGACGGLILAADASGEAHLGRLVASEAVARLLAGT